MTLRLPFLAVALLLASLPGAARPQPAALVPRFEAVAETRLLMEGLAHANYRGLQRLLKTKPADDETRVLARGQALLVAETGNLLLLRPPRNAGRDTWMRLGMELRDGAAALARKIAERDFAGSQAALTELTMRCNRCHQTFRVPVRVGPEAGQSERDT